MNTYMTAVVNEQVSVVAIYDRIRNEITPWRIRWQGKMYTISQIGFHHTVKVGQTLQHIFSVTDGRTAFRITHDSDTLRWILQEITEGTLS